MKKEDREKLEEIEVLLSQLQKNFVTTYKEIHTILETISLEADMEEIEDMDEEEELEEELLNHMEEIFGQED